MRRFLAKWMSLCIFAHLLQIAVNQLVLIIGPIAQLVEQWTENPCVAGSSPARTTKTEEKEKQKE